MGKVKSAVKKRREYVKDLLLAYVPDRTIARKCSEKFSTTTGTIFSDLRIIKKQIVEDSKALEDAVYMERLKMQHVSSLQRAMATAISRDNLNLFIRLSQEYTRLMDFNAKTSGKKSQESSDDKVSKMTDEELVELIAKSGGKFDTGGMTH